MRKDMNDTCEMWSLPWHALQRNLALGLGGAAIIHSVATVKAVNVQNTAIAANSWLGRARLRVALLPHQVRQVEPPPAHSI
jgi:hypothetical protein